MTDVHCHVGGDDPQVRELVCGRDFAGVHPWDAASVADVDAAVAELRARLEAAPSLGVGEIGLDRLKDREISPVMRRLFERQLALAFELGRPVVLHGAKCWGQVVKAVEALRPEAGCPAGGLLFHGFSRSDGLIPDIVALGGFISVGPAILNDHAVNYRELVKKIPPERLLVETDRTAENAADCPSVAAVLGGLAAVLGMPAAELEAITDANAGRFVAEGGRFDAFENPLP